LTLKLFPLYTKGQQFIKHTVIITRCLLYLCWDL